MLLLPLIYTGVASSVKLSELESLWPVFIMSLVILLISYIVTVCMGYLPCFRMQKQTYFTPLCIASTFPNIVALPIIIFPTLCEYGVVQDLVKEDVDMEDMGESSLMDVCNKQANAVVFTYFFGFSLVFWSIGHRTLVNLSNVNVRPVPGGPSEVDTEMVTTRQNGKFSIIRKRLVLTCSCAKDVIIDVLKSPGFVALILGFVTACITPLQRALFEVGGSLRVVGSALESLSNAGTTFATIVVAASLVKQEEEQAEDEDEEMEPCVEHENESGCKPIERKTTILGRLSNCLRSTRMQSETMKIYIWQVSARLLVTPGIVFFLLLKLDCAGLLDSVPNIAKLVLLINSAVPGALVVVVILKAQGLADEAAAVSKAYLPSYTLSVFTLAMWSSIGLMAFRSDSAACGSGT